MSTLHSQEMRRLGPEGDALRIGIGWTEDDLDRAHLLVETTGGESHPGSVHLDRIAEEVRRGARGENAAVARQSCTDMCDGIAQGTAAMDYSLPSREVIAAAAELHARAGHFDAVVFVSSCDKAVPAHLIAAARLGLPAVHVPGGSMPAGRGGVTVDEIGRLAMPLRRGELDPAEFSEWRRTAAPSCGSCAFMGTALTAQVVAESLGLALPGTAVAPAGGAYVREQAAAAGAAAVRLLRSGLTTRDILTPQAFENAYVVHAAVGGSTNFLLHFPAIAREVGVPFEHDTLQAISDRTPFLLDVRPAGRHPANLFWHAGGVPAVMEQLADLLHLDCLTVTGRTLGENLAALRESGWFEERHAQLRRMGVEPDEVIRPRGNPMSPVGSLVLLRGNLAPQGAVCKRIGVRGATRRTGPARPFDSQEDALDAIAQRRIRPGDVVVIRYEGPRATGMPEQYYVTAALAEIDELNESCVLVTDGRFSGASKGPCVGHVTPEAAAGGPIALVEEDDLVSVDLEARSVDIVGLRGVPATASEVDAALRERRSRWTPPRPTYTSGLLALYTATATSATAGAVMAPPEDTP
jgi:dihydroxy-acid dehydratase